MTAEQLTLNLPDKEKIPDVVLVMPIRLSKETGMQLLLAKRKGQDIYTFPGGKREKGETLPLAALRELEEETGIKLVEDDLVTPHAESTSKNIFTSDGKGIRVTRYLAFISPLEVFTHERDKHEDWQWLDFHQIKSLILQGNLPADLIDHQLLTQALEIFYTSELEPRAKFCSSTHIIYDDDLLVYESAKNKFMKAYL